MHTMKGHSAIRTSQVL